MKESAERGDVRVDARVKNLWVLDGGFLRAFHRAMMWKEEGAAILITVHLVLSFILPFDPVSDHSTVFSIVLCPFDSLLRCSMRLLLNHKCCDNYFVMLGKESSRSDWATSPDGRGSRLFIVWGHRVVPKSSQ